MKLFTKYSRINVLATIIIFLIASVAFFITLNYVLINQIDGDLKIEEGEIISYVRKHDRLPEVESLKDQIINFTTINEPYSGRYFKRTSTIDPEEKNKEDFREMSFGIKAGDQWYKVSVLKSLEDTDDLLHSILLITFSTILVILIVSFIINRVVLKKIWQPFYQALAGLKDFKISTDKALQFPPARIEEFQFMNQSLERLTKQAHLDYLSLKTFTENASHEIQTPIAVIRSKLDLLIQDEHLTEQQSQTLQSANNAIEKLTRLNQSLLLLAKIENNQYEEIHAIHLKNRIEEKIEDFQELWLSQNIHVSYSLKNVVVSMNEELADILLNNLFSNTTRHNFMGGTLSIELHDHRLVLTNSSQQPALDNDKMFHRFYKPPHNDGHNGLGLSIIKQICDASGFLITYEFHNTLHTFSIHFDR